MSIKGDVLEYLMTHPNEVVSLTSLASGLDVTLVQVRSAISNLRNGATQPGSGGKGSTNDEQVSMRDQIRVVSRGYAVKYCPPEAPATPKPSDMPAKVHSGQTTKPPAEPEPAPDLKPTPAPQPKSPVVDEWSEAGGPPNHPESNDVQVVLAQLGPTAFKIFSYVASCGGQNVTGSDVMEATGLSRGAVSSAFYNTLFNPRQLNRNARRLFVKVGKDVYRMSLPGDGVIIGKAAPHSGLPKELPVVPSPDPVVARTVEKLYGDKEAGSPSRIFEEIRALPDGAVLIADQDGRVYKAKEV